MEARATQSQAFGAAHARLDGESDLSGGQDSTQLDEALRIAHASVNYIASNGPGGICSIGMTGVAEGLQRGLGWFWKGHCTRSLASSCRGHWTVM